MTKIQLVLSIGIPSLPIVLSWIDNNTRFERIEKRLDSHDARFEAMEARSGTLQAANHKDALEILRAMMALLERAGVVETKQDR